MLEAVFFDLDGTILNTNELIIDSFRYTFYKHFGTSPSNEELYATFGEPLRDTLARYAGKEDYTKLIETYREYNVQKHDILTKVFPGVEEMFVDLRESGLKIAIVTSKLQKTAARGLNLFNLMQYIDCQVSFEDTEEHKPEAGPVLKAMELLNVSKAIMVGDSPLDSLSAAKAGIPSVSVGWSVYPHNVLIQAGSSLIIDNFHQLLKYIDDNDWESIFA